MTRKTIPKRSTVFTELVIRQLADPFIAFVFWSIYYRVLTGKRR